MARVFSGIQPSGELHIGNYLGAVQNWVRLQHQHECLLCVVDLHAITQPYDPATLPSLTLDMAVRSFAAGLCPGKRIAFAGTPRPEHTQLHLPAAGRGPLRMTSRPTPIQDYTLALD